MKKFYSLIATFMLLAILFTACGNPTPSQTNEPEKTTTTTPTTSTTPIKECDEHVDENKDGLCDRCGGEFKEDQVPVELKEITMYLVGD
jgi:uncharacterized paraquat-inducible protein A